MTKLSSFWLAALGASLLYLGCDGDASSDPGGGGAGAGVGGAGASAGAGPVGGGGPGGGSAGAAVSLTGLPCPVERVLQERCQLCHGNPPLYGAPMPLVTRGDLLATSAAFPGESVGARSLARMTDGARPMPQPPNAPATAAEVAVLQNWVNAGMPAAAAGEACGVGGGSGAGGSPVVPPINCEPDVKLQAAAPYELAQSDKDVYVCFGAEIAAGPKRHITAATPLVDDLRVVHHLLVFQVPENEAASPQPTPCAGIFPSTWKMIYGWGPGGLPLELPAEAGFPTEAGAKTHFVVQMHYSNLGAEVGHRDQTGIGLCSTTQLRPNDADIVAFGKMPFTIPADTKSTLSCDLTMGQLPQPVRVFRSWPHMHTRGESLRSEVRHASGAVTPVGAVLNYDFENQISYDVGATINPGDTVRTECTWDNVGNVNPVSFGEETLNEMCFNFLSYYPRVPGISTLFPALTAGNCTQTP